jgi:cytochrome c oxidase subunit II
MNSVFGRLIGGLLLAFYTALASAAYRVNFQPPVTPIASDIYHLHMLMMYVIVTIFCIVFGVMFYSIYAHRKSVGHKAAQFHENTTVEIIWTIIPFLILIGIAWPATKVVIAYKDTSDPDITIKVTGYQWKWGYDYLKGQGAGISFLSTLSTPADQIYDGKPKDAHYLLEVDHPMVVPVHKKVRILTTAGDVIHSFWVPAFGIKQDAFPGFVRTTWFRADKEGTYRGQCAELCGRGHAFMPIVVKVVSEQQYTQWVAEHEPKAAVAVAGNEPKAAVAVASQETKVAAATEEPNKQWTLAELKARGEKVYAAHCVACHQANGKGLPPTFPALDGSKIATGPKAAHINRVLNGKPGTAMVAFGKQLSDTDIAAVITYERNAWGNKMGDMVLPAEVKAARK